MNRQQPIINPKPIHESQTPQQSNTADLVGMADAESHTDLRVTTHEKQIDFLFHLLGITDQPARFETVIQTTLKLICEYTGWFYGEVWLPDATGTVMECSPVYYVQEARRESLRDFRVANATFTFAKEEGLVGSIWATGVTRWTHDIWELDSTLFRRLELARSVGMRGVVGVPIVIHDQVVAVLAFAAETALPQDSDLIKLVDAAARQVSTAMQRHQVETAEHEQRVLAEALRDSLAALTMSHDVDTVMRQILNYAVTVVPADAGSIILYEADGGRVAALRGYAPEIEGFFQEYRFSTTLPKYQFMRKTRTPYHVHDTHTASDWIALPNMAWIRSSIGVPIEVDGEVIGLLCADSGEPDHFRQSDVDKLSLFARYAAQALENAYHTTWLESKVTERTAELTAAKDQVEAILNYSMDALLLVGADFQIQRANPAFHRLFGCETPDCINRSVLTLIHPEHLEQVREVLASSLEGYTAGRLEIRALRLDGTAFEAELSIGCIQNSGLVCTFRDISESKRARTALEEERNLLRTLIDSTPDFIYVKDLQHRFLVSNLAHARARGAMSPDEMIGKTDFDFFPEVMAEQFYEEEELIFRTGQPLLNNEQPSWGYDGGFEWALSNKVPLRNLKGELVGLVGITRDITERRERERQLRLQASVQAGISDAVITADLSFRITGWNLAAARIYGWNEEEVLGKSMFDVLPVNGMTEQQRQAMSDLFMQNRVWEEEVVHRRKDGVEIAILSAANLLTDSMGMPFGIVYVDHDITELKRREEQLRYEASVQANMSDAVIVADMDFIIRSWNPAAARIYGWQADEVTGKNMSALMKTRYHDPETREEVLRKFLQEGAWKSEVFQQHKDGHELQIFTSVTLLKDDQGQPQGIIVVNNDITDLKQAEQELAVKNAEEREMQAYLKALHDITLELTAIEDLDTFYRRAVELGRVSFGLERLALFLYDPATGRASGTYGTDANGNLVLEYGMEFLPVPTGVMQQSMTRRERFCVDTDVILTNDLEPVGTGWNAAAVLWNGSDNLGWLVADNLLSQKPASRPALEILSLYAMTLGGLLVHKRVNLSLRESEARYRLLIDRMRGGFWMCDLAQRLTYVNDRFCELLGYTREELIGTPLSHYFDSSMTFPPAIRARDLDDAHENLASERIMKHKDGSLIDLLVLISPLVDQEGEVIGSFAISTDITVQKQAEAALRAALTKEQELSELKSRFVSMASHEFRTPLASIQVMIETLISYRHKLTDDQLDRRLEKIMEQIGHLTAIMDDVLQFARIQARRLQFNPVLLDPEAICRSVVDEYENHPETQHRLVFQPDLNLPHVKLDRKLIRQILNNLISNALKYSPENQPVTVHLKVGDQQVKIIVEDHGIGIPPSDLEHLFEPFHRASNVGVIAGTGLGLVITRESVELHGGSITVASTVDRGTTFTVCIPIDREEQSDYDPDSGN